MSKALNSTLTNSHKPANSRTLTAISLACLFAFSNTVNAQPQTMEQKASYAVGVNFVNSIKSQGIKLDENSLMQGIKEALSGTVSLTQTEMAQALEAFKAQLIKQQEQTQQTQLSNNKQLGDAFLAENKNKKGVVTLKSGLQYKVLQSGTGAKPKLTDKVTTNYRGTLIDGTEFDSSYSRNKPSAFPVNRVIPGWTEALQLMSVGDKWQLYIPSELAYGKQSVGGVIEANSTLIFEIELLKIN